MTRTNIDIDEEAVARVMARYDLPTNEQRLISRCDRWPGLPSQSRRSIRSEVPGTGWRKFPSPAARFQHVDLDPFRDFAVAAELYRASARDGHPIRSSVDCLTAAVALRTDAILVHRDHDFRYLAAASRNLRCLDTLDDAPPEQPHGR